MKYVGARYMPKFVGVYDATTAYEALSVVDNGMGTSYVANKPTPNGTPLTDTEYWAVYGASSGAILNLQQQINDMKDGTISGSLQDQINDNTLGITALSYELNPDVYTGTDSQKLQACIDALAGNNSGVIVIKRDFTLDNDIDLKTYTLTENIAFIGVGGTIDLNGHKFYSSLAANRNYSGATFNNIIFTGIGSVGFDMDTLIRCFFIGCTFRLSSTSVLFKATQYVQQLTISDSHIIGTNPATPEGSVIEADELLSVQITNCRIEGVDSVIKATSASHNLLIEGCTIESINSDVITLGGAIFDTNIISNYFETILSPSVAINISGMTRGAAVILGNYFKAPSSGTTYTNKFSKLPSGSNRNILFANNAMPVANSIKYEIVGNNGVLRGLTEFLGYGGNIDGDTSQIPAFKFLSGGCAMGATTTTPCYCTFGSNGINSMLPLRLGATYAISGAQLEDGTTLTASDFTIDYHNDMFMSVRCTNASTRATIANKTVIFTLQLS